MASPILLYDGVCGLCNRFVHFTLAHDHKAIFRFASLQSAPAARILTRHGAHPGDLDTVYVVVDYELPDERMLSRSDAVLFVLKELGGIWRTAAFFIQFVPRFLRNRAYDLIARYRYRVFGRTNECPLPRPQDRRRFLDG